MAIGRTWSAICLIGFTLTWLGCEPAAEPEPNPADPAETVTGDQGTDLESPEVAETVPYEPTPAPPTPPRDSEGPATNEPVADARVSQDSAQNAPAGAAEDPNGPAAVVREFNDRMAQKDPTVVWEMLPASYQEDVKEIVHTFGENMDAEIYNGVFDLLNRLVEVLRTKKEFIVDHPTLQQGPGTTVVDNYENLVDVLDTLVSSQISDIENVKALDVENFLDTTVREFVTKGAELAETVPDGPALNFEQFEIERVEVVSNDGTNATLMIYREGQEPQEAKATKVDGKWIPAEMARSWEEIEETKQAVQNIDLSEQKPRIMQALNMFNMALDRLEAAKSDKEFAVALGEAQGYALQGLMMTGLPIPGLGAPRRGGPNGFTPPEEAEDVDAPDIEVPDEEAPDVQVPELEEPEAEAGDDASAGPTLPPAQGDQN